MTYYEIGKIVNTQGLKGEVRVIASTDFPDDRFKVGEVVYLKEAETYQSLVVRSYRRHKNFHIVSFQGHDRIETVEGYRDHHLYIHADQQTELAVNEFYYHEIIGCQVKTLAGDLIGQVVSILAPGANDVWVVKTPQGKEVLIPYIESVVKRVDLADQVIEIELIEGLLD